MNFLLPPKLIAYACSIFFFISSEIKSNFINSISPLAGFSSEWNEVKYLKCNTASKVNYMTSAEKEVIYILNLARMNPSLFANSVVKKYPANHTNYYTSLMNTLLLLKPVNLLIPDSMCFKSARCHATTSGAQGYVGHNRSTEECKNKKHFNGECCDYGHNKPLDIIMSFLIDEGVSSLGHREICLDSYNKLGVSIQYHKLYGYTAVLDFYN
jgi:uncharacterized protein YkwD